MIKPCAKITLDIQQPSTATFVALKKRDIGRKIIISLSDGGFPYEIADDCYAVLTAKKPDNKTLYNHCEIDGNTIVYEITEQTTAAAGRMKAEVKLYGADDTLITSATFRIIVDGTVYDEGEVESTSEFSALTELIVKVTELLNSGDLIGEDGYSIFLTSYELPFVADGGGGSIALNTSSISLTEIQTQGKTVKAGDLVISENGVVGSVTAVSAGKASVKSVVNIVSPHVGDNGNWYVGTIDTGVSAKGEDGVDGKDGYTPVKGVDYFDGQPGKDGSDGKDGYTPQKGIDYFDGQPGEKGDKGDPGEKGEQGEQGIQGIPGEKGEKGDTGAPGADGAKGDKGDKGDTGATGAQGEPGKDGADGKDGTSATHSWNGTVLTITSASGTSSADLKGEKGDKGDTGAQGIQGEKGEKGDTGEQGPKGDTGDTGPAGQSAYAAAQAGGYTDTQANFYADLAAMQGLAAELAAI